MSKASYLRLRRTQSGTFELAKRLEIETLVREYYDLLTARNSPEENETSLHRQQRLAKSEAQLPATADKLSRTLLGPAGSQLGSLGVLPLLRKAPCSMCLSRRSRSQALKEG